MLQILQSKYDVVSVFKNIKSDRNVIPRGIKIFSDQTKQQKEYYMKIKRQLEELITDESSKTIKYINNIPTIVDKNGNKKPVTYPNILPNTDIIYGNIESLIAIKLT